MPGADATLLEWEKFVDAAQTRERDDPVESRRGDFLIPTWNDPDTGRRQAVAYFVGNSLGCQPVGAAQIVHQELEEWAKLGVEAHWHARRPWIEYQAPLREMSAQLAGCAPSETVLMNGLTVNLHFLMATFYRPKAERYRILVEANAFPSDLYAVSTQAVHHGLDPSEAIVRLPAPAGEYCLATEDVVDVLERDGATIALVLLGGVNYLSGEVLDMREITAAAHSVGCLVGWDLAHAIGNVPLALHEWDVDFAAWCTYKYLNGGPGAVAGCFIHERHAQDTSLPRLGGWWGADPQVRFKMHPGFVPHRGADGWQISNPPILALAPLLSSLQIFDEVGITRLRERSQRMTAFLESLLDELAKRRPLTVTTPRHAVRRGCQISIDLPGRAQELCALLKSRGVLCDFREPATLRVAPVPLYNTYGDILRFVSELDRCIGEQ